MEATMTNSIEMKTMTEDEEEDADLVSLWPKNSNDEDKDKKLKNRRKDPFYCVCDALGVERIGETYVITPCGKQGLSTRLIVGPHWTGVVVTFLILSVSASLFLRDTVRTVPTIYSIVTIVLFFNSTLFLLLTACTDPGIIHTSPTDVEETADQYRYCETCDLYAPRSSSHCEDCGLCIEELDHHCPWMGKCIGRNNMAWFRLFNVHWIVFMIYAIVVTGTKSTIEKSS